MQKPVKCLNTGGENTISINAYLGWLVIREKRQ